MDSREKPLQPPLETIGGTPPTAEAEVVELGRIAIEGVALPFNVALASSRGPVGNLRVPDEHDIRQPHPGVAAYRVLLVCLFESEFDAQRPIGGPGRILAAQQGKQRSSIQNSALAASWAWAS